MFQTATGWLGWTPDVVMETPFCQITLALDGKMDFVKKTNPWGSSEKEDPAKNLPANPAHAASQLAAIMKRRAQTQGRKPGAKVKPKVD